MLRFRSLSSVPIMVSDSHIREENGILSQHFRNDWMLPPASVLHIPQLHSSKPGQVLLRKSNMLHIIRTSGSEVSLLPLKLPLPALTDLHRTDNGYSPVPNVLYQEPEDMLPSAWCFLLLPRYSPRKDLSLPPYRTYRPKVLLLLFSQQPKHSLQGTEIPQRLYFAFPLSFILSFPDIFTYLRSSAVIILRQFLTASKTVPEPSL